MNKVYSEDDFDIVSYPIYTKKLNTDEEVKVILIADLHNYLKNSKKFKEVANQLYGTDISSMLEQVETALGQVDKSALAELQDVKIAMYLDKDSNVKKITVDTSVEGTPLKLEVLFDGNDFALSAYAMGIKLAELSVKNKDDKCTIYANVISMLEATINIEGTVKYNEKIEKADVSNSVKVDEITETQAETMMGKIMGSKGLTKLITAIEKIMPTSSYELDSDYDFDYEFDY